MRSFIEQFRQISINNLFESGETVKDSFPYWNQKFQDFLPLNAQNFYDLGSHLREISFFAGTEWANNYSGPQKNMSQSTVSRAGTGFEVLITYYLNLGLIGSNAVAIKAKKNVWPQCLQDATTLVHNNMPIKSENDIVVITFPDHSDFTKLIPEIPSNKFTKELNRLTEKHFSDTEVGVVQTKTSWADNSQSLLLYVIVYGAATEGKSIPGISLGTNGYNLSDLKNFNYSFVTMPTQKNLDSFTPTSTAVVRVNGLSGGNYWGLPSKRGVASSISEIFNKNFVNALAGLSHRDLLNSELPKLSSAYSYFNIY